MEEVYRNLKVKIAYNGTNYSGFQFQDNAFTIQEAIEIALKKLLKEKITINGCSRTDKGVHAREFYFSFYTRCKIPPDGFVKGMNTLLPPDIAVLDCEEVELNFHARFDAKAKVYEYLIYNAPVRDVFNDGLALHHPYPLDVESMDKNIKLLIGEHDFGAFCKSDAKAYLTTTVREIFSAGVTRQGDYITIEVCGNGFLHNMVRIIVGTLLHAEQGKLTAQDISDLLNNADRTKAGVTAPPIGLYLKKVIY